MSRTYRSLNAKRGTPRYSKHRFTKLQRAHCHEKPETYDVPSGLYEIQTKSYEVDPDPKDRVWVSKGTPHAKPEYTDVLRQVWDSYKLMAVLDWRREETGRYYLEGPVKTIISQHKQYLGRNPEYSCEDAARAWELLRAFRHHRLGKTGGRRSSRYRFYKRDRLKQRRREGTQLCYEAAHDFSRMQQGDTERCDYYWNRYPQDYEEAESEWYDDEPMAYLEPWEEYEDPVWDRYSYDIEEQYDDYDDYEHLHGHDRYDDRDLDYDYYDPRDYDHDYSFMNSHYSYAREPYHTNTAYHSQGLTYGSVQPQDHFTVVSFPDNVTMEAMLQHQKEQTMQPKTVKVLEPGTYVKALLGHYNLDYIGRITSVSVTEGLDPQDDPEVIYYVRFSATENPVKLDSNAVTPIGIVELDAN